MPRPLVLYHGPDCADGFCAAWVARRHFGGRADCVAVQYGQPPPDVAGRETFILDFSYKRPVMEEVGRSAWSVVVLDHHKTAQEELAGLPWPPGDCWEGHNVFALFDMKKSGGRLAWEHFFPGEPSPWLVDYTEDRDLWLWKLPRSKEVSACIASYPFDFAVWDGWSHDDPQFRPAQLLQMMREGEAILRYQSQQVESACKNAWEVDLDGHKVLCTNATQLISEVAGKLAEGRPFGCAFFIRPDGKKVYSLRSREGGVDVSEVARRRGGGGHKHAAGFEAAP